MKASRLIERRRGPGPGKGAGLSDFFQTGAGATLHRLGRTNVPRLEEELENFSLDTPMALVLPCHLKELATKALRLIVRELKDVTDLGQIPEWYRVESAPPTFFDELNEAVRLDNGE